MQRQLHSWWSPATERTLRIAVYGHWGIPILMFPTAMADALEYERFGLVEALRGWLEGGRCKLYCVDSLNAESWLAPPEVPPAVRSQRHRAYNRYITEEVVPFIYAHCRGRQPILTAGASFGAYHAANLFFRRPDLFVGVIAMSGEYNLLAYTGGYMDEECYFNSPVHYLANLDDHVWLPLLRSRPQQYFVSGQGAYERPEATLELSRILSSKAIPHVAELWGAEWAHDWPTWRAMMPVYLERVLSAEPLLFSMVER